MPSHLLCYQEHPCIDLSIVKNKNPWSEKFYHGYHELKLQKENKIYDIIELKLQFTQSFLSTMPMPLMHTMAIFV